MSGFEMKIGGGEQTHAKLLFMCSVECECIHIIILLDTNT